MYFVMYGLISSCIDFVCSLLIDVLCSPVRIYVVSLCIYIYIYIYIDFVRYGLISLFRYGFFV